MNVTNLIYAQNISTTAYTGTCPYSINAIERSQ